jgi:hypothetical protein
MSNVISFDETIKWSIGGTDYHLKKPSMGVIAEFSEGHAESKDDAKAQMKLTVSFLEKCGLPGEICYKLNVEQVQMVVDSLVAKKKG